MSLQPSPAAALTRKEAQRLMDALDLPLRGMVDAEAAREAGDLRDLLLARLQSTSPRDGSGRPSRGTVGQVTIEARPGVHPAPADPAVRLDSNTAGVAVLVLSDLYANRDVTTRETYDRRTYDGAMAVRTKVRQQLSPLPDGDGMLGRTSRRVVAGARNLRGRWADVRLSGVLLDQVQGGPARRDMTRDAGPSR